MTNSPDLPCPEGWHWQNLGPSNYSLLAPIWRNAQQGLSRAPFWRHWFHALVDIRTGSFDPHFMHVIGLFDGDDSLRAIAAEVEHFESSESSQVLIQVSHPQQGQELESFSIAAALTLAKIRGSRYARFQYNRDSPIYALTLGSNVSVTSDDHWKEVKITLNRIKFEGFKRLYKILARLRRPQTIK